MEELRSWWEVPSIAHFCSLFRAAFDLPDFDIEDLEDCLFAFCEDQESPFVIDLICRLLRGCYGRKDIESFNYEVYLKDIFKYRAATEEKQSNPFEDSDFKSLDLRTKVEVLHRLCDYRLDAEDVMDQLKGLDGDNMRVSALGSDDRGATYWYFYGSRLYKEDPGPIIVEETQKKKKKGKEKKEPDKNKKKSKEKKGKQKKKEVETTRSRRGRVLSKTRHFGSSESEEESEDEEVEKDEEYITPVKQQKSQGRQSRSARKSKDEQNNEEIKDLGTRRSSRRSSTQSTPIVEKKTRGRGKKSTVNGNVSDEDSDDEWNTPLAKTIIKIKIPTPAKGSSRKRRQNSVESSDHETEEVGQATKSEDTDQPKKKRGKPRQAVKITPDSSVNGDVDDQNINDIVDDSSRDSHSSTQNSIDGRRGAQNVDVEKEVITEESKDDVTMTTEQEESYSKVEDNSVEGCKVDTVNDLKVKDESEKKADTSLQSDRKKEINEGEEEIKTEMKEGGQSNMNNNHDLNLQENDIKEEVKTETKQEMESTIVKEENSEMIDIEGNNSDNKVDSEIKIENKPAPKPLYKNPRWHLVCSTLEDWQTLSDTLKDSNTKAAKDLYKCIVNDFLPEMPAILEARERDKKRRQAEMAPRRVSARITMKMKEFQEQERILEEARLMEEKSRKEDEDERERLKELERQEEERKMREERQKAREERQKRLELREYRAQLIREGKELPPELIYTGNTTNSKYREDDDRVELDKEIVEDMEKMLEEIKSHKDSWPFLDPVEEEIAPGYHDIIKRPMDLSGIEKKLKTGSYRTTKRFVMDFNLMINNCFQFSGADSELGRMATRLRRYINRCVKIYLDKDDGDDTDVDFHGTAQTQTQPEKKWRPRRAATSRAMDTLRGAFDDDEFEELTSTPGHEYAAKPQKKRLIPELSGESTRKSYMLNGDREAKAEAAASQTLKQSSDSVTKETKILTVNGKTFVYKFNTPPTSTKKKIVEKPLDISLSPDKVINKLSHANTRMVYRPPLAGASSSPMRNSTLLVSPRQSSAILPASSMPTHSASTVASVNTPNGPKIIRIMSPTVLNQGKLTAGPTVATNTPSKAIRISDGMLLLDGKPTGIHISGKTKIIYKGAVTSSSTVTPEQNAVMVSSGQASTGHTAGLTAPSGMILSTGGDTQFSGQNAIQVVPGSSNLSDSSNSVIRQLNPSTGQSAILAANTIHSTKPVQSLLVGCQSNQTRLVQPLGKSDTQSTGSIRQLVVSGNQQTGSFQQVIATGNQQSGSIQQLVVGGNQSTGVMQQLVVGRGQTTGSIQSLVVGGAQSTGTIQQLVVSGNQVTGSLQPNAISGFQSGELVVVHGSQTNTSNSVLPSLISSTVTPSQAIKTIQPVQGRLEDSIGQIPSVCEHVISNEQIVDSSNSKTIVNLPLVQTLSSSVGSNEMSTFPPYVSTASKSGQSEISNKPVVLTNTSCVKTNMPGISLLSKLQRTIEQNRVLSQTSLKNNESLMGPPLLVPPKRKLSGSPENISTSPSKQACLVTSTLNTASPQNITSINSSVVANSMEILKTSESLSGSSDQQFPPYKISHSSPDKGNLFDILKTNIVDSSSQENVLTSPSNDSGLSQGLMNKVSTFAANLHSKSLAEKLSTGIPGHMLQKSPTKEQPVLEHTEESCVTVYSMASDSSIEGQDPS